MYGLLCDRCGMHTNSILHVRGIWLCSICETKIFSGE